MCHVCMPMSHVTCCSPVLCICVHVCDEICKINIKYNKIGAAPSDADTGAIPALGGNCAERATARRAAAVGSRRGGDGAAEERRTSERRHENGLYAAGRLQIRDSKVQAARRKACYQRANLTEAAQSADYRSRGDRPEAMGDVHGDCATVQPRSRRRIVDPTFPLKIPSGYAAAFGLCGFSSAVSLPYLTLRDRCPKGAA